MAAWIYMPLKNVFYKYIHETEPWLMIKRKLDEANESIDHWYQSFWHIIYTLMSLWHWGIPVYIIRINIRYVYEKYQNILYGPSYLYERNGQAAQFRSAKRDTYLWYQDFVLAK